MEYLEKSAEKGNEYAEYKLGAIYANKENEEAGYYDLRKAVEYLEKSAEKGNGYAQYKLGIIYSDRSSGYYRINEALKYLNLSAEQGNGYAQCKLGCMYYFGKEVPQNKELGKYWLKLSAEQGNDFAQDVLNGGCVGINFSYCLLKSALTILETMNRQSDYNMDEVMRTKSRQAAREAYLHQDHQKD